MCSSNSLSEHAPRVNRITALLLPAFTLCFALVLGIRGAGWAPDAAQYRLLALGQRSAVPSPFSARILGPALAGWLGRVSGLGVDSGFLILGVVCLLALLALVAALLWRIQAPTLVYAGIFLLPFWVDVFHDYYLPDPLHAAILAALLLCLLLGHSGWALLLLLPAYLARESTSLVALCLVFACWRRIPLRTAFVGVGALLAAALVGKHFGHGGPPSVHGLNGGSYIAGKFVWSFFKNVLGLPLWSNTLPECTPLRTTAIPAALHLGAIHEVGFCQPSAWGPARLVLAWFGLFGIGPALALTLSRLSRWRNMLAVPASQASGEDMVLRFSFLYGLLSLLITPLLGASADRLVEYGWPFYFIALPWVLTRAYALRGQRAVTFVALHLLTAWLGWLGFHQLTPGYVIPAIAVFTLNVTAFALLRKADHAVIPASLPSQPA
jgi:hypothetical protein